MRRFVIRFWPFLAIFLSVVIFAWPYLFEGKIPFASTFLVTWFAPWNAYFGMPVKNGAMPDIITQIYPWRKLVIETFKQGQWPLWNPYSFSGTPHLANFQSAVFHPLNWLFLLFPRIDAWSLLVLSQPLLAALFTYLYCRQLKLGRLASLLSSLAFGFCGFMVCWMAYGTMAFSLLWLPLVFYAIEKKSPILISLALAFSFFSGHFQISLYVALASLFYLLWQKKFSLIIFWFLGILIAMPQILPSLEFYRQSFRSTLFAKGEVIPWQYMVTLLAPDFYGNSVTRNDWFGHYAEWNGFIGLIPLFLAIYSFWRHRNCQLWFFVLLGLFSLSLALPTPFLDILIKLKIPVISTSAASRVICLFSFAAAVLAGFGLDQLRKDWQEKKFSFTFLSFLGFLFLIIWVLLLFFPPLPADKLLVAKRNFILPTGMFLAFVGLFLLNKLKVKFFILYTLYFILALSAFDVLRFAKKWMPFDPREFVYPSIPVAEFLNKKVGFDRVFGNLASESQVYFGWPGIEGYDALYIRRYGEFISAAGDGQIGSLARSMVVLNKNGLYAEKVLRLLGVKYLYHAIGDGQNIWAFPFWRYPGQFKLIYQDEKHEVYENLKVLPRAFLVYDYQVIKEDQPIIDRIFAKDFDLEKKIVLEEEPDLALVGQGTNLLEIKKYTPTKIDLGVTTSKQAFLFLSDNFYPGWKALVDGRQTKIYRADYTFRAVEVAEGKHQISFIFRPSSFLWGLVISGMALLILLKLSLRK